MIRFVDLGHQISLDGEDPPDFAFFNTVTDKFLEFNGVSTWSSWQEFKEDYTGTDLERYERLVPAVWKEPT